MSPEREWIQIGSADDPRVAEFTNLTDVALRSRIEQPAGIYLAESGNVIRRAIAAGHTPRSFLMAPKWLESMADLFVGDAPVYVASEEILRQVTGFNLHRGAIAAMNRPELPTVAEVLAGARRVLVLEDVVDHTNVGAAVRSAAALGMDAVLVTPRCADPLYRRSVRVSMGTIFQLPWTRIDPWPAGIQTLKAAGLTVVALSLTPEAISLDDLAAAPPERLAFVLGTEGHGLARRTVADSDVVVRIPMSHGVDSLNVAAAAAVAFWATRVPGA